MLKPPHFSCVTDVTAEHRRISIFQSSQRDLQADLQADLQGDLQA
jgi:hypothetical protein